MKKFGKAALSILKGIAPLAASAIGGPFAGPALAILSQTLGIKDNEVEDYILSASPDQLLELKKADMQFKQWMRDADIREEQLNIEDRSSARQLARDRGQSIQAMLSVAYTVGYFLTLASFVFGWANVSVEYQDMTMTLIGALAAPQLQILNFWFGSSKGSGDKTSLLANGT